MVIERRGRSPLGAFVRSPLGAFGDDAGEGPPPTPILQGFVRFVSGPLAFDRVVDPATCTASFELQTLVRGDLYRMDMSVVAFPLPTDDEALGYWHRGQSSGAVFRPIDAAPDYICGVSNQQPPRRQKTGDGLVNPSLPNSLVYPFQMELLVDGGLPGYALDTHSHVGPLGFIQGETVDVYDVDPTPP